MVGKKNLRRKVKMIDYKYLAEKEKEIAEKYDNSQPAIIEELKEAKRKLNIWIDYSIEVREQKFKEEMDQLMEGVEK